MTSTTGLRETLDPKALEAARQEKANLHGTRFNQFANLYPETAKLIRALVDTAFSEGFDREAFLMSDDSLPSRIAPAPALPEAKPVASDIAAHLSWLHTYARTMDENNWRDIRLRIARQVSELEAALARSLSRTEP